MKHVPEDLLRELEALAQKQHARGIRIEIPLPMPTRTPMDEKTIAEIKAKHPTELALIKAGGEELVFRKPTRPEFSRFRSAVKEHHVEAGAQLLRDTLVFPVWDEFIRLLEKHPALEDELTGEVIGLAKASEKVSAKKL